jgi:hypothetical protein
MTDDTRQFNADRRIKLERRSGADTRSEEEKRLTGERRSPAERRSAKASDQPSKDQLSLFAKRIRRAMRDPNSRHMFGHSSGEDDFRSHPDVLRTLDWLVDLANS